MKKTIIFLSACFMLLAGVSFGQDKKEALWLNETAHNFGKIPQGKPVYTFFELKGLSDSLKLEMVQAGCGCTTPEFRAGSYAPGETVKIKVGFNAAAAGPFNKPVTITYNGGQQKVIMISGTVDATPATPAPVNKETRPSVKQ